MKAKRVMALVLSAMLTVGSLDTAYLPVLAAGEEQTVTAAEDEVIEDEQTVTAAEDEVIEHEQTVTAAEDEAIEDEQTVTAAVDEEADEEVLSFGTTSDGFTYEETSKGYKITGYTGAATAITIPDKIGDTYVTEIGAEAFSNTDIVSVTIPEHITALGKGAFSYCTSLRTVDINSRLLADTYTDINAKSYAVFYNAGSLDGMTVTFGEGVEYIPANLFRTYEEESKSVFCRISKVVIADSVTKIGKYAFSRCYNLTTLEGADGVETIGNNAFEYCGFKELPDFKEATLISEGAFQNNTKLKTAVVGGKVQEIGYYAFGGNTKLEKLVLPRSLTTLGKCVFSGDIALTEVTINSRLLADTYTDINAKSYAVFYNAGSMDGMTVTFGEGVEYIPANLFRTYEEEAKSVYCRVSKVVIADSVTKIGNYAFSRCYKLAALEGADGVETIGNNAFEYCGFKELPDFKEATLISERAFQNNTKLKTAVVGGKVQEIKYYAFGENTKLEKLVLPRSLTTLGSSVFSGDTALTDVTINSRLLADTYTDINAKSYAVFYNAGSMDGMTVTFGEGVEYIPANLFRTYEEEAKSVYCRVSKVVIADSVTKIGNHAFSRCYKLAALEGADGVETIGNNAFEYCGFKELPDFKEATLISERAFQNNTKLKTAVVGGKVQEIGYYAFGGNTKLEKLVLPRSLTTLGSSAFSGDIALTEVTINSRLLADIYTDINAKSYAVFYNAGAVDGMNVVFGSDVESIPANLFRTYEDETKAVYAKVKRVEINSSLRSLGDYAFGNCYMLDEIHFYGNAPKTFANNAFYNVKANAYYPSNDKSWKSDVLKDYGGTITWKKEDGSDVPVSGITLDKTSVDIKVGRTVTLTATVTPSNAANKDVSWSTGDSSIATVDNGVVKAVAVGETTITVTTVDGGKQASCKVTVTEGAVNDGEEITLPGKKKAPVTAYVTFVTNGGDEQDSYYTINKKGNKASLHKLVRKGYTFKGWYCTYTDKKGKEKTKKLSALTATTLTKYAVDGELILKAQFNPNKYTVKYYKTAKLDGKKVKMKGKAKSWKGAYSLDNETVQNVTIADGSTITAKDTTLELIGWTRVKYGTETEFATGDSVSLEDLIPDKGKTVKLYPVFVNKQ